MSNIVNMSNYSSKSNSEIKAKTGVEKNDPRLVKTNIDAGGVVSTHQNGESRSASPSYQESKRSLLPLDSFILGYGRSLRRMNTQRRF